LEHQRILRVLEIREPALELAVKRHRAGDRPDGAGAGAELLRGARGRTIHPRVVGQPEVVVRRQVDHLPAVEPRARPGRSLERPRMYREPLLLELVELFLQTVERSHVNLPGTRSPWPSGRRRPSRTPPRPAKARTGG